MGAKPKVGGAKKRAAKAPLPAKKEKSQRERFLEAARAAGVDETGKEFDRALTQIMPSKRR